MTKEEFVRRITTEEATLTVQQVNEFFSQNVYIPKGTNRHPYADVLHAIAEGILVEMRENNLVDWYTPNRYITPTSHPSNEWRIKPAEPVWEYQFSININGVILTSEYMTQQEWSASELKYVSRRNDEMKRERK